MVYRQKGTTETVTDKNKAFCKLLKAYRLATKERVAQMMYVCLSFTSGSHFCSPGSKKPQCHLEHRSGLDARLNGGGGVPKSQSQLIWMHTIQIWTPGHSGENITYRGSQTRVKPVTSRGMVSLPASRGPDVLPPRVFRSKPTPVGTVAVLLSPEVKLLEEAVWQGCFAES